jgi:hypothetical protein
MPNPEQLNNSPEQKTDVSEVAGEQLEQLLKKAEQTPETNEASQEKKAESAKEQALEKAISIEKKNAAEKEPASTGRRHGIVSKKEREKSFKRHMTALQTHMSLPERTFSKIIHNKAVEKTSEFVGSTLARPNAVLSGAVFAFFLVLGVYLLARHFGYVLSGFETIGAFIVGWVLGVVYDYLRLLVVGKQ